MGFRRSLISTLVAAVMLAVPAAASATPLVVDQFSIGGACSDSFSAAQVSVGAPWCSIAHAVAAAPAGSTVLVRAGSYPYQSLHGLGSRSAYVTFEPYGYGTASPEGVSIAGISTASTSFLRFVGFRLIGSDTTSYRAAIQIYIGSHDIQFINNDVSGEGVQLQTATHVLLQGNYIHNLSRNCSLTAPDGGGLFLTGGSASNPPADNLQVVGNTIQDTPQDAINLVHNLTNVVIDGNNVSTSQTPQCGDHTDLVQIEGDAKGPFTITNNVFHDGVQFILRNATGLTIENNLMLRVQQWMQLVADPGARIINNTWWYGNGCPDGTHNCTAGSLLIRDYTAGSSWAQAPFNYTNHMTGAIIENNIMRLMENDTVTPVPATDYHEDYDLVYGPRQNNYGLQGTHTLFATPTFLNPTAGNYQLTPTSPGAGAGDPNVAPPTNTQGQTATTRPDIGALQALITAAAPPLPPVAPVAPVGPSLPSTAGANGSKAGAAKASSAKAQLRLSTLALGPGARDTSFSMRVRCNERCRVNASGSVSLTRAAARLRGRGTRATTSVFRLRTIGPWISGGRATVLRLRLVAALRSLHRGDRVTITVRLVARSADGAVVTKAILWRLRGAR